MSKQTRKEKRSEEQRILAEMDEAMRETAESASSRREASAPESYGKDAPEKLHCKRCKTLMENGVCPTCGFRVYVPMDEKKRKKIRWIVAGVCLVAFLFVYFLLLD